jgi:hypothetical protein
VRTTLRARARHARAHDDAPVRAGMTDVSSTHARAFAAICAGARVDCVYHARF